MVFVNAPREDEGSSTADASVLTLPQNEEGTRHEASPEAQPVDVGTSQKASLVLSAIEAGRHGNGNRRGIRRRRYRVTAALRLYSDADQSAPWIVYTRDVHSRGLGFITAQRLPLGHGGVVELPTDDGGVVRIPCTLLRCREAAPGWFEGSVYFNRDQPQFVDEKR